MAAEHEEESVEGSVYRPRIALPYWAHRNEVVVHGSSTLNACRVGRFPNKPPGS